MRLVELTVRNFRGFGTSNDPIRLDRDLILVYGPNGFGKTSLAEAIEWLFYGSTKRRLHGEGYSKAEYAGTYANVHNGRPVQVDLKVLVESTEYLLSRRLIDGATGELTETLIDGVAADFASIGANGREAVYPVVAQNGLQTFIHSKPKDRRDAIGSALGLDELTTLKSSLESARASFQRTPPAAIVQARKVLAASLGVLAMLMDAAALVTRWQKSPMQIQPESDIAILLKASANLCGVNVTTVEEALVALRAKRTEASRAVFDTSKITPTATSADDATTFVDMSDTAIKSFEVFESALAAAIAALAATYNAALLAFWGTGLSIAPGGDTCPMCETPNLTAARRAELRKRISDGAAAIASDKAFAAKITGLSTVIASLKTAAAKVCTKGVTTPERELLRTLLNGSEIELDAFLATSDQLTLAKGTLDQAIKAADDFLADVESRVTKGAEAPKLLTDAETARNGVLQSSTAFAASVISYHQQWPAIELILNARIAAQGAVAKIDAVGKTLKLKPMMELHAKYDAILIETLGVIRTVEQTLQTKQTALLATRGGEVKTIYDLLNPGANVVFHGMEPGTDQLKLHATSFGVRARFESSPTE